MHPDSFLFTYTDDIPARQQHVTLEGAKLPRFRFSDITIPLPDTHAPLSRMRIPTARASLTPTGITASMIRARVRETALLAIGEAAQRCDVPRSSGLECVQDSEWVNTVNVVAAFANIPFIQCREEIGLSHHADSNCGAGVFLPQGVVEVHLRHSGVLAEDEPMLLLVDQYAAVGVVGNVMEEDRDYCRYAVAPRPNVHPLPAGAMLFRWVL